MRYRKYTVEQLATEALKYTSRQAFKKGSPREYSAAHNYGEIDNITVHMTAVHPRICSKCGNNKELKEFVKNSKCSEGHSQICTICSNTAQNLRAALNPNTNTNRAKSSKKIKAYSKAKIIEHLGGKLVCADCNYTSDIFDIFDFHHLDRETKLYQVSSILDRKWEIIEEEINKCVLLCANCHRIRHYKENNGKDTQEVKTNTE